MTRSYLKGNVNEWYHKTYPTDELYEDIKEDLTFQDIVDGFQKREDFYELVGKNGYVDSLIRERIFSQLEILLYDEFEITYENIYKAWLDQKPLLIDAS